MMMPNTGQYYRMIAKRIALGIKTGETSQQQDPEYYNICGQYLRVSDYQFTGMVYKG